MTSSKEFLKALVTNDRKLILDIYEEFFQGVKKFIVNNKGTEQDAQDVFQKALLQLTIRYSKEQFEINGAFGPYLFVVCKNLWLREVNKSKERVTNDDFRNLYSEMNDNALALMEQKRHDLFAEKLALISENCKRILLMYFNKIPYAEMMISLAYNSETVVRQRVFKCKKKLTELIKGDKRYLSLKEL